MLKHFQLVAKPPLMNLTRFCPPLGAATMHDSLLIPGRHIAHDKLTIAAHFLYAQRAAHCRVAPLCFRQDVKIIAFMQHGSDGVEHSLVPMTRELQWVTPIG